MCGGIGDHEGGSCVLMLCAIWKPVRTVIHF